MVRAEDAESLKWQIVTSIATMIDKKEGICFIDDVMHSQETRQLRDQLSDVEFRKPKDILALYPDYFQVVNQREVATAAAYDHGYLEVGPDGAPRRTDKKILSTRGQPIQMGSGAPDGAAAGGGNLFSRDGPQRGGDRVRERGNRGGQAVQARRAQAQTNGGRERSPRGRDSGALFSGGNMGGAQNRGRGGMIGEPGRRMGSMPARGGGRAGSMPRGGQNAPLLQGQAELRRELRPMIAKLEQVAMGDNNEFSQCIQTIKNWRKDWLDLEEKHGGGRRDPGRREGRQAQNLNQQQNQSNQQNQEQAAAGKNKKRGRGGKGGDEVYQPHHGCIVEEGKDEVAITVEILQMLQHELTMRCQDSEEWTPLAEIDWVAEGQVKDLFAFVQQYKPLFKFRNDKDGVKVTLRDVDKAEQIQTDLVNRIIDGQLEQQDNQQ